MGWRKVNLGRFRVDAKNSSFGHALVGALEAWQKGLNLGLIWFVGLWLGRSTAFDAEQDPWTTGLVWIFLGLVVISWVIEAVRRRLRRKFARGRDLYFPVYTLRLYPNGDEKVDADVKYWDDGLLPPAKVVAALEEEILNLAFKHGLLKTKKVPE